MCIKLFHFILKIRTKQNIHNKNCELLNTCKNLESEGFEISYIDVDNSGMVKIDELEKAIKDDTILISIMYVNNEVGTIQI